MSIYTIGDIHGRADLLRNALSSIMKRSTKDDKIVFLGDIIDRGTDTKECIELILKIKNEREVIVLKGNHEEWMLETKDDYSKHSWILCMEGLKTIKSYSVNGENALRQELDEYGMEIIVDHKPMSYAQFFDSVPKEHLDFFMGMKDYHVEDNYVFVHAGISVHEEDISKMDSRKLRWGFEGFPEEYRGKRKVVYGHFSKNATKMNNRIMPYVKNKTVCIDTSKHNILTIFISPDNKIVQIGKTM